ncbi:hypothetical protein [Streptomyces broussonetiae]|uniref:Uncharacterized protein n=1 Tax=Streptomyces broussonetiae TaxID=2686304 RepID=A0A6I6N0V3_9ACTN|nr:hypothetical protein [Streptomyces broussonetiae]QHA02435.1 hypothetical protein GQF42_03225 [Streptomyces broussonetiae]
MLVSRIECRSRRAARLVPVRLFYDYLVEEGSSALPVPHLREDCVATVGAFTCAHEDAAWRELSLSTDSDGLPDLVEMPVARVVRP